MPKTIINRKINETANLPVYLLLVLLIFGQLESIYLGQGVYIYLHEFILAGLGLMWILNYIKKPTRHVGTLLQPFVLFIGAGIISLLFNLNNFTAGQITIGALYLIRFILYFCLYLYLSAKPLDTQKLIKAIYLSIIGFAVIGNLQYWLYPDLRNLIYLGWDPHYFRLFSTVLDPNFAGIILVVGFISGLMITNPPKILTLVFQSFILLSLVLTYSRSAYLALVTGLAVKMVLSKKIRYILVIAVMCVLYLLVPKSGLDVSSLTRWDSTAARFVNWNRSFTLILEAPIFGYGFNTLRFISDKNQPGQYVSRAGAGIDNSFLFVTAATGIVGLWAFINLWKQIILLGTKKPQSDVQPHGRQLYISLLAAIVLHSMFNNTLFYPWIMIYVWIYAALFTEPTSVSQRRRL
ncbi:hypothetical protein A2154_03735 [Candidatus Gottesmanbacteria bacterium RBG_16_43_7]|uniref:O-antigen ligase-related domain-containing protein n=1 Tax=Candidatus Gottesmanbacteria bacterium RBG_16_43_7 TaxID=1798373 RepID=A0A1F5Z9L3_9BACT|nr:MAG: hypothetical protein A2154_03735 [Candidatus Gottesmanbacteria bacterium RBG_16_43_7]